MCTDREPQSRRIQNTGLGTDACTQTRDLNPNVFETRVETVLLHNKNQIPNMFD